ncbi:MAG TPA: hypothetical protein VFC09_07460 [Candidatus Dormibacteraeota bacterium]|nr:hypothetical protein [Candidatus Dormibacteraeota bacterium]
MAELRLAVSSERAALSTQFWEFCKGIEHFYYALAFTSSGLGRDPEVWRTWARLGFHLAIKSPPPLTPRGEVLKMDMRLDGKVFDVTCTAADATTLQALSTLLRHIDEVRPGLQSRPPEDRVRALRQDPQVSAALLQPLDAALQGAALYPDDVESFHRAFDRALAALTDEELVGVEQSFSAAETAVPASATR